MTSATSKDAVPPGPLKNVEPCTLLSPKEVADLHAGAPRSELVGYVRTCRFTEGKGFVISYGILDEAGLDAISANGPITPVPTVGTHRAVQSVGGSTRARSPSRSRRPAGSTSTALTTTVTDSARARSR
ncbi:hypothetical protein GCM10029964_111390 [Kibdelosporangium lantanae]